MKVIAYLHYYVRPQLCTSLQPTESTLSSNGETRFTQVAPELARKNKVGLF